MQGGDPAKEEKRHKQECLCYFPSGSEGVLAKWPGG